MSAVTAIYHIVINTHRRELTLPLADKEIILSVFIIIFRKHLQNAGIEWNDYRLT